MLDIRIEEKVVTPTGLKQIYLLRKLLLFMDPVKNYRAYYKLHDIFYQRSKEKKSWERDIPKTDYCLYCSGDKKRGYTLHFSETRNFRKNSIVLGIGEKSIPAILQSIKERIEDLEKGIVRERNEKPWMGGVRQEIERMFRGEFTHEKFESYKSHLVKKLLAYAQEVHYLNYDKIKEGTIY